MAQQCCYVQHCYALLLCAVLPLAFHSNILALHAILLQGRTSARPAGTTAILTPPAIKEPETCFTRASATRATLETARSIVPYQVSPGVSVSQLPGVIGGQGGSPCAVRVAAVGVCRCWWAHVCAGGSFAFAVPTNPNHVPFSCNVYERTHIYNTIRYNE